MVLRAGFNPELSFVVVLSRYLAHSVGVDHHVLSLPTTMATVDPGRALANAKKRRGVARALLTRLVSRIKDLEDKDTDPMTLELAQRVTEVVGFGCGISHASPRAH